MGSSLRLFREVSQETRNLIKPDTKGRSTQVWSGVVTAIQHIKQFVAQSRVIWKVNQETIQFRSGCSQFGSRLTLCEIANQVRPIGAFGIPVLVEECPEHVPEARVSRLRHPSTPLLLTPARSARHPCRSRGCRRS